MFAPLLGYLTAHSCASRAFGRMNCLVAQVLIYVHHVRLHICTAMLAKLLLHYALSAQLPVRMHRMRLYVCTTSLAVRPLHYALFCTSAHSCASDAPVRMLSSVSFEDEWRASASCHSYQIGSHPRAVHARECMILKRMCSLLHSV